MILLDTNIVIQHIRKEIVYEEKSFISIVTVGELKAFAKKRAWGINKLRQLQDNLDILSIIDISHSITDIYAEIDAFSQGLLSEKKLNTSARNMGKNDLWIAATAYYFNIPLQTTDSDFDHLNNFGLKLDKVTF
jgi:tRNA(fMet)-specific endonuclease VapC